MANVLTEKIGPLPTWGWLGLATASIGGWALIEHYRMATAASSTGTATGSTTPPDFVFNIQNQLPPEAPAPTGPTPKPGPPPKGPAPKPKPTPKSKPKCPAGYYYVASFPRGQQPPFGSKKRAAGGWCVPSKYKK